MIYIYLLVFIFVVAVIFTYSAIFHPEPSPYTFYHETRIRDEASTRCENCNLLLSAILAREGKSRGRMADCGMLNFDPNCHMCKFFSSLCLSMEGLPPEGMQEATSRRRATNFNLVLNVDRDTTENTDSDIGSFEIMYANRKLPRDDVRKPMAHIRIRGQRPEEAVGSLLGGRVRYPDPRPAIATWLSTCLNHDHRGNVLHHVLHKKNKPRNIHLVDCYDMCIVRMPFDSQLPTYAALSYVWGKVFQFQLLKENYFTLLQRGSLSPEKRKINESISHAMDLCRELRIRYLWVDALCIVQDDKENKKLHLNSMDCIYHLAHVTIVSAAGKDAAAGLPPLRYERQWLNRSVVARGLVLYEWKNSWSSLDLCLPEWSRRGWTYQELVLSTRLLIFTTDAVFGVCPGGTRFYDPLSGKLLPHHCIDLNLYPSNESLRSSQLTPHAALNTFFGALDQYVDRQLTYDNDNINAFTGILQVLEPSLGPTWHGMLLHHFSRCLHHNSWNTIPVRVPEFPSWSWAGWRLNRTGIVANRVASGPSIFRFDEAKQRGLEFFPFHNRSKDEIVGTGPLELICGATGDFLDRMGVGSWPQRILYSFVIDEKIPRHDLIFFWALELRMWVSPPGEQNMHSVSVTRDDRPYDPRRDATAPEPRCHVRLERRWAKPTAQLCSFIVFGVTPEKLVRPMMVEWRDRIAYRAGLMTPSSAMLWEDWMKLEPTNRFIIMG